ncbi:hypothetical protein ASZ78_005615 [Callipepla squamata]|uniref:RELT-like protein 1 n=1 Tax=Callipepla squamata TaxID=9009 RepID=A0A226NKP8_CALSU|nr:hypothetical protein ASZ78_005615 [Callipepla squamata]
MAPPATSGIPPIAPSLGPTAVWLRNRSDVGDVQALASHDLPTTTVTTGNNKPEHLEYVAFVLVPVFFIMGLLGILICHVLKKKGYRCTTEAEEVEEEEKPDEKIANADVLKAMVADSSVFEPERFRVTKVEHKSNSKERKSLMSVTGVEGLNGDMPATPAKQEAKEAPATPVKEGTQERRSSE